MNLRAPSNVIDEVSSRCAECGNKVNSQILERGGKVYQTNSCSQHHVPEALIFSDATLYRKLDWWNGLVFGGAHGETDRAGHCDPEGSLNEPMLAVIDVTNRCNFSCPMCFASIAVDGAHYFLPLEAVESMLRTLIERPLPCRHIQFSGGEPTLHPQFTDILRKAREMGFDHIQVATNGSRFIHAEYAQQCAEAGLHTVYLQFDGMNDEVYRALRGRPLTADKIRAVENITRTGMRLVLVPTIAEGVNVDQLGPIFRFALEHSKHVTGISIQPAAHVGRVEVDSAGREPFNLAVMARAFGDQTGLTRFPEDWLPLSAVTLIGRAVGAIRNEPTLSSSCDAHCSLGTYFYIDDENRPHCLPRFLDIERFFSTLARIGDGPPRGFLSRKISEMVELNRLSECFDTQNAPAGLTFSRLLRGLDGWEDKSLGRGDGWFRRGFNGMFVAGMHFMDARSYNLRRLRRCIIQYVTTSHELVPFCSYNAGARLRCSEESVRLNRHVSIPE